MVGLTCRSSGSPWVMANQNSSSSRIGASPSAMAAQRGTVPRIEKAQDGMSAEIRGAAQAVHINRTRSAPPEPLRQPVRAPELRWAHDNLTNAPEEPNDRRRV